LFLHPTFLLLQNEGYIEFLKKKKLYWLRRKDSYPLGDICYHKLFWILLVQGERHVIEFSLVTRLYPVIFSRAPTPGGYKGRGSLSPPKEGSLIPRVAEISEEERIGHRKGRGRKKKI
jgi:hypothetical protein